MTYRIAVLGLLHEANSFAPGLSKAELQRVTREGAVFLAEEGDGQSSAAGFLALGAEPDVEVVPLIYAFPTPCGPIAADALAWYLDRATDLLREHGPYHAVFLPLHGAAVAERTPSTDVAIARRVREAVGDVPIATTLDLHGNADPELAELATVLNGYQTNPHVDARARADKAGRILLDHLRGRVRPVSVVVQVPAALDIRRQGTADEPMRSLVAAAAAVAVRPGILDASVMEGYPWSDVPHMGMSAIVVADGDRDLALAAAEDLARTVWAARDGFTAPSLGTSDAVAEALTYDGRTMLMDTGDNIGAGAPGDSTVVLAELIARGASRVVSIQQDPDAVAACWSAGVGARVRLTLRGNADLARRDPLELDATVVALREGPWVDPGRTHGGRRVFDSGRTAAVLFGDHCHLVLTSRPALPSGLNQLYALGLDPASYRILVGKGVHSPKAGYTGVVDRFLLVDTPGVTSADLSALPYEFRRSPLFPFERG